jgi:hypothetical protein
MQRAIRTGLLTAIRNLYLYYYMQIYTQDLSISFQKIQKKRKKVLCKSQNSQKIQKIQKKIKSTGRGICPLASDRIQR